MSTTPLPPLLASWVESALGRSLPPETRATCHDCAMCSRPGHGPIAPEPAYLPETKCCTYWPKLPNFSVGMILADGSPEMSAGRARIASRVKGLVGATPLGLGPGPDYWRRYKEAMEKHEFGRRVDLLCPYFDARDGGLCTIWRHREAVCSTFLCRFEGGGTGRDVWASLKRWLLVAEWAVTRHCLMALDLDATSIAELFEPDGKARSLADRELHGFVDADGRIEPSLARRIWGRWHGREEAFYLDCAELVRTLDVQEVRRLGGVDLTLAESRVRAALEAAGRSRVVPRVLYRGTVEGTPLATGEVSVRSSMLVVNDPVRVAPEVWEALDAFDGRSTEAALEAIAARLGRPLPAAELAQLVERLVLVPPDGRDLEVGAEDSRPLAPGDRLRFFRGYQSCQVTLLNQATEDGREKVTIAVGAKEIGFEEAELFEFARRLAAAQNGFHAEDALQWVKPDAPALSWDQVRDLLELLRRERILQRLPSAPA